MRTFSCCPLVLSESIVTALYIVIPDSLINIHLCDNMRCNNQNNQLSNCEALVTVMYSAEIPYNLSTMPQQNAVE